MDHQAKVQAMYRHMDALGVSRSTAAPPLWRLLWRAGIEIPPPLFIPFLSAALGMGPSSASSGVPSCGCSSGRAKEPHSS